MKNQKKINNTIEEFDTNKATKNTERAQKNLFLFSHFKISKSPSISKFFMQGQDRKFSLL